MIHIKPDVGMSFDGYTLILPSVSVGNVGQLCVDLWISSLNCEKIGFVWHPAVMPVVGGNPFGKATESLMISSELYIDKNHKLLFMQIRSPILKAMVHNFLDMLVQWIQQNNIFQVIVLTGSTYTLGNMDLIEGTKLRYMFTTNLLDENKDLLRTLQWTPVNVLPTSNGDERSENILPGGGFSGEFFDNCAGKSIRAAVLVKFCSEGDNIPDAYELAEYLDQWLQVMQSGVNAKTLWVNPFSWKHLFGKLASRKLY